MSDSSAHWEDVYGRKKPDEVSWFRPHLERSLAFIERACPDRRAAVLDVGGGASTLVDDLLVRGFENVTVLDLSQGALDAARRRLGARGEGVQWRAGDITTVALPERAFDFWHDRAVFHFLRAAEDRRRYVAAVRRSLKPGGTIVVATFGPNGPERCSGLQVARYSADELHREFGAEFQRFDSLEEVHTTPSGSTQQFVYCACRLAT